MTILTDRLMIKSQVLGQRLSVRIAQKNLQLLSVEALTNFLESQEWKFAKTMPQWPHHYIVRANSNDRQLFESAAHSLNYHGYMGKFYKRPRIYFEANGLRYWTMQEDITTSNLDDQFIINRDDASLIYQSKR